MEPRDPHPVRPSGPPVTGDPASGDGGGAAAAEPISGPAVVAPVPAAVWTSGPSLALGLGLLVTYLCLQALAMILAAGADLVLRGDPVSGLPTHLQARQGFLFAVATLLAAPAASLAAVLATAAGARRLVPPARRRAAVHRHLGLVRPAWRATLLWLLATAAVLAVYEGAARLLDRPPLPDFMVEFWATGSPWLLAAAVVLGAPLVEEVIFRGFLLPGLAAGRLGRPAAVALTALLWALIHGQYDPFDMAAVFALGLVFGAARLHTHSLWPPLLLHAAVNALAMVQIFAALG